MLIFNDAITDERKKKKTGFVLNVATLSIGTIIAQFLGILTVPIIARLFSPEVTGISGVFLSIVNITGFVSCFTYQMAIVLPKSDYDSANLFVLCLFLVTAICLVIAFLLAVWGSPLFTLLGANNLLSVKWFIPLGVFLIGVAQPLQYWNSRYNKFKRQAVARVGTAFASNGALIVAGVCGSASEISMIICRLIGFLANMFLLCWQLMFTDIKFIFKAFQVRQLLLLATRYKNFPLLNFWSELLTYASYDIPTILIAAFFGASDAGLFIFANRIVDLPNQLLAVSIGQVFFQKSASEYAKGSDNMAKLFKNVLERLIAIGLFSSLFFFLTGPVLFKFVLGDRWSDAGTYAAILALWLSVRFVSSPLSVLYIVYERQWTRLFLNIASCTLRMAAIVVGGYFVRNIVFTLTLYCLVGIFVNFVSIFNIAFLVQVSFVKIISSFLRFYIYAIPTILIVVCMNSLFDLTPLLFIVIAGLALVPYAILVLRNDLELRNLSMKYFRSLVG